VQTLRARDSTGDTALATSGDTRGLAVRSINSPPGPLVERSGVDRLGSGQAWRYALRGSTIHARLALVRRALRRRLRFVAQSSPSTRGLWRSTAESLDDSS